MNKKTEAIILGIMCFILTIAICIQINTVNNNGSTVSGSQKQNDLKSQVLKMKEKYETALGFDNVIGISIATRCDAISDEVLDYLDELKENEFDIIVLDPPAFTKSRRTVQKAYNGYKRINKQAMKVLKNGGYLITCSCSRFMETANFEKMLREAASEAGVVLKQVSVTQQNADHPILWTMEETSYLKFYIFQII